MCSILFETVATLLAIPEEKQKCIDIESACQLLSRPLVKNFLNMCTSKSIAFFYMHAIHWKLTSFTNHIPEERNLTNRPKTTYGNSERIWLAVVCQSQYC